jgi:hypothetical protein
LYMLIYRGSLFHLDDKHQSNLQPIQSFDRIQADPQFVLDIPLFSPTQLC